jgi:hypothetical protein
MFGIRCLLLCFAAVVAELPTLQYKEGRLAKEFIYHWKNDKPSLLVRTAMAGRLYPQQQQSYSICMRLAAALLIQEAAACTQHGKCSNTTTAAAVTANSDQVPQPSAAVGAGAHVALAAVLLQVVISPEQMVGSNKQVRQQQHCMRSNTACAATAGWLCSCASSKHALRRDCRCCSVCGCRHSIDG